MTPQTFRTKSANWKSAVHVTVLAASLALVTACGGGPSASTPAQPTPTRPSASFAMPTTMITPTPAEAAPTVQPTSAATAEAAAASAVAATVPTPDLARGQTVYVNRKCGDCHGEQGEGVPDKGSAIAGTVLSLQEFTEVLRTGGKGTLGNEHIFGAGAISPGGMTALHAWLQSLPPAE